MYGLYRDRSQLEIVSCLRCKGKANILEWDTCTLMGIQDADAQKLFVSLTSRVATEANGDRWYKCPLCGQWNCGEDMMAMKSVSAVK